MRRKNSYIQTNIDRCIAAFYSTKKIPKELYSALKSLQFDLPWRIYKHYIRRVHTLAIFWTGVLSLAVTAIIRGFKLQTFVSSERSHAATSLS